MAGKIFVARATQNVMAGDRKVLLRRGITTAEEGAAILDAYGDLFRPLVPDFAAERKPQAAAAPAKEQAKAPAPKSSTATGRKG